jgi:hypothetical protein
VNKEYLLELEIPPINLKINDYERNTVLLNATIKANSLSKEKT